MFFEHFRKKVWMMRVVKDKLNSEFIKARRRSILQNVVFVEAIKNKVHLAKREALVN